MWTSASGADHLQIFSELQGRLRVGLSPNSKGEEREKTMANGEVHDSEANGSPYSTNAAALSPPKALSVNEEDPTSYPPTPAALLSLSPATTRETVAIPPPDTGYAWTFLVAGFTIGAELR